MVDVTDLGENVAGTRERRLAALAGGVLVLSAALVTPFVRTFVGVSLPVLAIIISLAIAGFAMTGVLLWTQSAVTRSLPVSLLALGYGITAAIMFPYLLLYRGLWPQLTALISADRQTPAWLWLEWHLTFVLFAALFQIVRARTTVITDQERFRSLRRRMAGVTAGVYAALVAPAIWIDHLPRFSDASGTWTLLSVVMAAIIAVIGVLAATLSYRYARTRPSLDVWLGIALIAMVIDPIVSAASLKAFTVGWYLSRLDILVASVVLLVALLVEVANVYQNLATTAERLRNESLTDALTDIHNRRGFDQQMDVALRAAKRDADPVSLLVIDIDHFKAFNDAFGHPAGDRCLKQIAAVLLQNAFRPGDTVARIGGEEFAIIMRETELIGARSVAERIRAAVEDLAIPQGRGAQFSVVTISIGVAYAAQSADLVAESLLFEADQALYRVKSSGRNGVLTTSDTGTALPELIEAARS